MGKINAEWHRLNPMPPRATTEQRYKWHQAHARACACRPISAKLAAAMRAAGFEVPETANPQPRQRSLK